MSKPRLLTAHFTIDECKCHCCGNLPLTELVDHTLARLEELRTRLGGALIIGSGYRCPKHNKAVGGVRNSMHLQFAVDVAPATMPLEALWRALTREESKWGGIGYYDTFMHLDMRQELGRKVARWDERREEP